VEILDVLRDRLTHTQMADLRHDVQAPCALSRCCAGRAVVGGVIQPFSDELADGVALVWDY
jgi:hypothetical protein